ncbi:MAG: type II secretion system minor pseudopilin GspK [Candidatus Sedimenticola sp. 20ELBAFRAG]
MKSDLSKPARQQGVALLTAMLIASVATILAVQMMSSQQHSIRHTSTLLYQDQAYLYALGVEDWASGVLSTDIKTNQHDGNGDSWTKALPKTGVTGGFVEGTIEDMQGRFNINNLVIEGEHVPEAVEQFKRLLVFLKLDESVAQAVTDWLDADMEPQFPNGAEDDHYSRLSPPYRSANRPMSDISELRLVKGVDDKMYKTLQPHIAALPEQTPVNINSASVAVLMSLGENLNEESIKVFAKETKETPITSLEELEDDPLFEEVDTEEETIGISSAFFRSSARVSVAESRLHLQSLLHRVKEKPISVLSRSRGA